MNNHIIDLTGKKFGRLTVKEFVRSENGNAVWKCICNCGNEKEVLAQHLKRGHVQSCGCLAKENGREYAEKNLRTETAQKNALKRKLEVDAVDGTMKSALTRSLSSRNKSGIKGVRWDEKRNKWEVSITFQKKLHFLGRFEKKDDAIKARRDAEDKYFKPIIDKSSKPKNKKQKIDRKKLQDYINKFPEAPVKEIADFFNVSITAILYHINRYNLKYNKKSRTNHIDQVEFEHFVRRNHTLSKQDLAEHFNVTRQTVNNHIKIMRNDVKVNINIEELKKYIKDNQAVNMDELSRHFNVNRRQLFDVIRTYNIKYERKTPRGRRINVDELRNCIIENPELTRKEIASKLNISVPSIEKYIKKYDLPYKPKNGRRNKQ